MSKLSKAQGLFNNSPTATKVQLISLFAKELNVSLVSAKTYYDICIESYEQSKIAQRNVDFIALINQCVWFCTTRNLEMLTIIRNQVHQTSLTDQSQSMSHTLLIIDGLIEELKYKIDLETTVKNLQEHVETLGGTL